MKRTKYWIKEEDDPGCIWRSMPDGKVMFGGRSLGWTYSALMVYEMEGLLNTRRISKQEASPLFPHLFPKNESLNKQQAFCDSIL